MNTSYITPVLIFVLISPLSVLIWASPRAARSDKGGLGLAARRNLGRSVGRVGRNYFFSQGRYILRIIGAEMSSQPKNAFFTQNRSFFTENWPFTVKKTHPETS